ncbi:MAG: hypothetical protein ACRC2T_09220, partial [Thermoguttaceae bacterium]
MNLIPRKISVYLILFFAGVAVSVGFEFLYIFRECFDILHADYSNRYLGPEYYYRPIPDILCLDSADCLATWFKSFLWCVVGGLCYVVFWTGRIQQRHRERLSDIW